MSKWWFILVSVALGVCAWGLRMQPIDGGLQRNRFTGRVSWVYDGRPLEAPEKIHVFRLADGDEVDVPESELKEFKAAAASNKITFVEVNR